VAGGYIAPHEIRIMDAFNLGKTVRFLAVLDGALLLLNCAYVPVLFLLLLWVRFFVSRLFAERLKRAPGWAHGVHK